MHGKAQSQHRSDERETHAAASRDSPRQQSPTEQHVQQGSERQALLHAQPWHTDKAGNPGAQDRAHGIQGIDVTNTTANHVRTTRHNFTDQGKCPTHAQGWRQDDHERLDKGQPQGLPQ